MSDRERALLGPRALKERGSPEWCWQTMDYLQSYMKAVSSEWSRAEDVLNDLIAVRAWQVIPAEQPYGTLNRMLREEVGLDERAIKDQIRKARLAAQGRPRKGDIVTFPTGEHGRGNAETYTVRRLRRDRPDLAKQVEQGKLSANKAAIAAGFRSRSMSIPANDAGRAFRRLTGAKGMDREQLVLLAKLLKKHLEQES